MDFSQLAVFQMSAERLNWVTQRQTVLAQNIANADTPDFDALDIEPFDEVLQRSRPVYLATSATHPDHMVRPPDAHKILRKPELSHPYEVAPSGNNVILEQQMMNVAETTMIHQLTTNLYRKHSQMLQTAMRGGGR